MKTKKTGKTGIANKDYKTKIEIRSKEIDCNKFVKAESSVHSPVISLLDSENVGHKLRMTS